VPGYGPALSNLTFMRFFLLPAFLLLQFCLLRSSVYAQNFSDAQYVKQEKLEQHLKAAKTPKERIYALIRLFLHHRSHGEPANFQAMSKVEQQMDIEAFQSADQVLMAMVMANKIVYAPTTEKRDEAKPLIDQLFKYAETHNLTDFKAVAKMREGIYYGQKANRAKAMESVSLSMALAQQCTDTMKADLTIINAETCNNLNEYPTALKLAFAVLEQSISRKDPLRVVRSESTISSTYRYLGNYPKAIHHLKNALQLATRHGLVDQFPRINSGLARLFILSGQQNLAAFYISEAYRFAGAIEGTKRLFNQLTGELIMALITARNEPLLRNFVQNYRQHFFISPRLAFTDNYVLAATYHILNEADSARLYIQRAIQLKDRPNTMFDYTRFLLTAASIASKDGDVATAKRYYLEGFSKGIERSNPGSLAEFTDSLKRMATLQGDYRQALYYDRVLDSLKLEEQLRTNQQEIMRQEVTLLEAQKVREAGEAEERKNQRNNLQYLAITAGIVALFLALLVMGMFDVSARTVRILCFFSFLLFFEFLFLLFKKKVAVITGGEPLKDLGFMVGLAALMVPLHHWAEHKAIHYLTNRRLSIWRKTLTRPGKTAAEATTAPPPFELNG
jgi:tetratricopeptide (TPR) repeat protein